uniref:Uncharacterized protein n=2 Tax=Oryza brachyantha TaxID=4533 RepID=J3MEA4_ORYBR
MISMFSRAHVVSYDLQGTDPHCATSFPDPHRRSSPTARGKSASRRRRARTTNLRRLSLTGPSGREKGRRKRVGPGALRSLRPGPPASRRSSRKTNSSSLY